MLLRYLLAGALLLASASAWAQETTVRTVGSAGQVPASQIQVKVSGVVQPLGTWLAGAGLVIGTTGISGCGTSGFVLYNNAGFLGCEAVSGVGTVTSVALTAPAIFTITGSPVTAAGTLGLVAAGTSGGVPYFDSTTSLASSGLLTNHALVLGGGAGAAPKVVASLGTSTTVLHGAAAGDPTFGAVSLTADVTGNLPNANLASQTANTVLGALTATTPSGLALPSCVDSGGNHLNYTSGTGFSCGTTASVAGTVTTISVATANGFAGTVANATTTPAITLTTTITGALKGNGTAISAAACTDLSDDGTACTANTGTSGATLPFLNGTNTWSGTQTFGTTVGTINTQSGTTYTLAATDCGKTILFTSGSAITLTTLNSLSAGCAIAVEQGGAGQITLANGSGATSHSAHSYTKTFAQYSIIGLFVDTNAGGTAADFIITGDGA